MAKTQDQQVTGTSSTTPNNPNVNNTVNQILGGVQGQLTAGPKPWNHSLYAGASPTTIQGWQQALGAANNPSFINGNQNAMNYANTLVSNGGMTGIQNNNVAASQGVGHTYGQLSQNYGRPGIYENTMGDVASGKYLNGGDPYFEGNLSRTLDSAGAGVNAAVGAGGRFGSGAHVDQLGRTLGGISDSARSNQYNMERDRQQQALQGIGNEQQQNFGNTMGALQGQLGANAQSYGMVQGGQNTAMNAAGSLPGMYQASLMPSQVTGAVGSGLDANANATLQGLYDQWVRGNGSAQNPQDQLSWASSLLGGNAQATGSTTTQSEPKPPWWQVLGGYVANNAGQALQAYSGMR